MRKTRPEHAGRFGLSSLGLTAALSLLAAVSSCQKTVRPDRFLLITLDTQRADHVSAYAAGKASTPHIDALAAEGILYKNAYSLIPITLPSHASLFFSERPSQIRNYNNGQALGARRSKPSLVNVFQKRGFATAAFISLGVLESRFGLDQGFDLYEDSFPQDRWYLNAGEVNERAFRWLEENKARPFFVWLHYSDPHDPYATPDLADDLNLVLNDELVFKTCLQKYTRNEVSLSLRPGKNRLRFELRHDFGPSPDGFIGRLDKLEFNPPADDRELRLDFSPGWFIRHGDQVFFFKDLNSITIDNQSGAKQVKLIFQGKPILPDEALRSNYRREVEYMDGQIGLLWAKLRELHLLEKTAVLLVGDHGEGLGDNFTPAGQAYFGHIHYLYDAFMKVPFIVKAPHPPGSGPVEEEFVSLLDVAPTIFGIMGFKPLPHFQGRNLLLAGRDKSLIVLTETYRPEASRDRFGLLSYPWHLILTPEERNYELFNLRADPQEKADIFRGESPPAELGTLKKTLDDFARQALSGKEEIRIDDKTKEMLRALGYIR